MGRRQVVLIACFMPTREFRAKFPPMAATLSNHTGTVVLAGGGF